MKHHRKEKAAATALILAFCVPCRPVKADPINANVFFVWQKPNERFQRRLYINLVKDKNTYFFPLVNWGDIASSMHQALVVDATGNWKCAQQTAPWGPQSQGQWCVRVAQQTADEQLVEYKKNFDNYQNNRAEPLGRQYEIDIRFNIKWANGLCSVEFEGGQETYGGTQEHNIIPITNISQHTCNVRGSH